MIKYSDFDDRDAYLEWVNKQLYYWICLALEELDDIGANPDNAYMWAEEYFPRVYLEDNPLDKCVSVLKDILYIIKTPDLRELLPLQQYVCIRITQTYVENIEENMQFDMEYDYLIVPMEPEVLDTLDDTSMSEEFWRYHLEDMDYTLFDSEFIMQADVYVEQFLQLFEQESVIPVDFRIYYDLMSRNTKAHYQSLLPAIEKAQEIYKKKQGTLIGERIVGFLEKEEATKQLLKDICESCYRLQGSVMHIRKHENSYNAYIRDFLRTKNYNVADQTEHGRSATGKGPGEIDLQILNLEGLPVAIVEGLVVKSLNNCSKEYFKVHLNKLLNHYNPLGVQNLYLTCYVFCKLERLEEMQTGYSEYAKSCVIDNFIYEKTEHIDCEYHNLYAEKMIFSVSDKRVNVYLLMVYMGD